jgi:hypothetical protein
LTKKACFQGIVFFLAVCLLPTQGLSECLQGDCANGKGTFVAANGRRYEGEFKNGLANGSGTLV